ncbi:MAG TPA: hypothetical protein DHV84_00685 [Desulfotomaculum sp.]|jgi:FdhE protein|nr:hypothetical protein [Desulfotomaculum sp.]
MINSTVPQVLVDFYTKLSQLSLPADSISYISPGNDEVNYGLENGIPLLNTLPVRVDTDIFFAFLHNTAEIILEHYPYLAEEIQQIYAALPSDLPGRELFANQVFIPGTNLLTHLQKDVSPEAFGFLLTHTVKPFMRQFGKSASSLYNLEEWLKGSCPVCGGKPSLSLLEKESGKRYLYCGLCEMRWRFNRLGCPYCANTESQFLTVEGEKKYRIYFCENCHGYLKTINEKRVDEAIDLFWEDIRTVYLDILALQEGYINVHTELPLYSTG